MKISSTLLNLAIKALSESMDLPIMTGIAEELLHNYDIYRRMGFRDSMTIPKRDAARQIAMDMRDSGFFMEFIQILIRLHTEGYKGRKMPITGLREIFREIQNNGYIYDQENKMFVEDPLVRKTRNWGALTVGRDYPIAFLRLDIVGNSQLVRQYPDSLIQSTYGDLRTIVDNAIDKRNGRVWSWEGDGSLVAFYFANKNQLAMLSAMEIINELFIYNGTRNRLDKPLQVRIAVNSGLCEYRENPEDLMKSETIKQAILMESRFTGPNSVTINNVVKDKLDQSLVDILKPIKVDGRIMYHNYSIELGD